MLGHDDAIQEEIDYNAGSNVLISGFFRKSPNNTNTNLMDLDDETMIEGHCTKPIGIQIHRNQRRSHVRLKNQDQNRMQAKTPHTVSQGAGVLLGNFPNAVTSAGSTRDFALETSKETGPLKSVYDMRVSHSGM